MTNRKKVVIVGGGFGGIELMKKLRNQDEFEVTLVDKHNYYFFPPLIYQVATGFMEPSAISYPFRKILRNAGNFRFRLGELKSIDPAANKVILDNGELPYDYLVLATGTVANFFGMKNVEANALPMKTISDALAMRNTLLNDFELATRTTDEAEKKKLLSIVIAGAGPTGVELAGMFAEMRKNILSKDYPELAGAGLGQIVLIDGAPVVMAPMSPEAQQYTAEKLQEMGVQIVLNKTVKDFVNDTVVLSDGSTFSTKNLIWAAGVTSLVFEGLPKEAYGRGKRLLVDGFNRLQGYENIFAIGDTALMTADANWPDGHPQLAQPSIQQATNLGNNLRKPQAEWKPFVYNNKGSMAIIGSNKAVADIPKNIHLKGFPAWFIWVFIHIMSLVTYKNRVRALYNWIGYYFRKDQSFRMIIQPTKKVGEGK